MWKRGREKKGSESCCCCPGGWLGIKEGEREREWRVDADEGKISLNLINVFLCGEER